jgi:hypothetical protein
MDAIRHGNLSSLKDLLERYDLEGERGDADKGEGKDEGMNMLFMAVSSGQYKIAKYLVSLSGQDIDSLHPIQLSAPLHWYSPPISLMN